MRRRHRGGSRVVTAVNAVRRHRRRLSGRGRPKASIRTSTAVAIRQARPRTLSGLAAQVATVGAMDTGVAAWRYRVGLAPVAATAAVVPAAAWVPGATATGLVVTGLAGLIAAQAEHPARRRRRGLAWWSGGVLAWMGAGAIGATGGMVWWQDLLVLAVAVAPGAIAWWRPQPAPGPELLPEVLEPAAPMWIPPAALLLGQTLEHVCGMDRSPIYGARVEQVTCPADGVAVAVVALPGGMHASQIRPGELEPGLEALLDRAGVSRLGHLQRGAVRVEAADPALGVTRIQVTASWSRALDERILAWTPPADLPEGKAWIGVDDAREDMVLESWSRGADGRVSVHHVWAIGRTGGGKSTTIRALVAPDLVAGREVLIPVDGKGTMGKDLIPFSLTGAIAKGRDASRQAVALAYSIFLARQARLEGDIPWMGPTPGDPIVDLFIDEYSTIGAYLTSAEVTMICEIARMARDLGVRIVQSGQIPLVDSLIGGSEFRSQCRIVLGHGILDATHDRIATQSGDDDVPSLKGLPTGRAVVLVDGRLVANRARVAFVKDSDLIERAAPRAGLHPDDLTDEVTTLLQVCRQWGTSKPAPVVDVRGLIAEWTDTDITVDLTTGNSNGGRAAATGTPADGGIPAQPRPTTGGARGGRPDGRLRQLVLTHVLTHAGVTRAQVRDHAIAAGYSASGAYKEISQLIQDGAVREDDQGRLIATLWDHQVPAAAGGTQ
jgi:hypothetical protein